MNLLCELIAGRELASIRNENCRIEGKADKALVQVSGVATDTKALIKRASEALDKQDTVLKGFRERQQRQAEELNKAIEAAHATGVLVERLQDDLAELHAWMQEMYGQAFDVAPPLKHREPPKPGTWQLPQ